MSSDSPLLIRREVTRACALILLLLAALDLAGRGVPLIAANLPALVAAAFLYLPTLLLPRNGPGLEAYGLHARHLLRHAGLGLLVAAIVLPGFLLGHHLWMTRALELHAHPDVRAYVQPPERLARTDLPAPATEPHVFSRGNRLEVLWHPGTEAHIRIRTDSEARTPSGQLLPEGTLVHTVSPHRPAHLAVHLRGGTHVDIAFDTNDQRLAPGNTTIGHDRSPPARWTSPDRTLTIPMSLWWIPAIILAHLLLVALPEELFFRGYLQKRIAEASPPQPPRPPPLVSRANLIASIVFALSHLVIGWDPARLAVFFPSLLFGLLRERTDGLAAPIVCHALFNLMVVFTTPHYLPFPP